MIEGASFSLRLCFAPKVYAKTVGLNTIDPTI
jgi:hypothetical protein